MQSTALTFAKIKQIKGCINALNNRIQLLKTRYNRIIDALDHAQKSKALTKLDKDDFEICKEYVDLKHTIQKCKQYP